MCEWLLSNACSIFDFVRLLNSSVSRPDLEPILLSRVTAT